MDNRYVLHHYPLNPLCREIRLLLEEWHMSFVMVFEEPWKHEPHLLKLNPAGDVPVLEAPDGRVFSHHLAIADYLQSLSPNINFFGKEPQRRAEVLRLVGWFDELMYREAVQPIFKELVYKQIYDRQSPDSVCIRAARHNVDRHMQYINHLARHRGCMADETISLADFAAAAQVSVLDYLGEVEWDRYVFAKNWYMPIKSRPSFQPLLSDRIRGILPASVYLHIDF